MRHLRSSKPARYDWFRFINKPRAVEIAEEHSQADIMCWLDSDLLILSELEALSMEHEEFVACASDKEMGSAGPGDPFEPLWIELCRAAGIRIDDLPWVDTEADAKKIRAYWNGGFFAYRRSSGFGSEYMKVCRTLLESKVITAAPGYATGINEMSALGLAMVRLNLRWKALPFYYNYPVGSFIPDEWYTPERAKQVKVLHYHNAMWPSYWSTFIGRLRLSHPDTARWLEPMGPMAVKAPLPSRIAVRALREIRQRQERLYKATCRVV